MWRLLTGRLEVPEPVSAAALRRATLAGAVISAAVLALNIASRWLLPAGARLDVFDTFLAVNGPLQALTCMLFLAAHRRPDGPFGARPLTLVALALCGVTATLGSWIVGGSAMGLNLGISIIAVGLVRLYLARRHGVVVLVAIVATDVVLGSLRAAGVLDGPTALPSPELAAGGSFLVATIVWRASSVYLAFVGASYAADRFRTSEHKLRQLNAELEDRVRAQVTALERAGRLRRYLAPQLVEEVLGAEQDPVGARERRPVTVMFADLRGFTPMVERLSPDALAATLNLYFDEVARIAFRYGGTIDKFIGDAVMVFFGAPRATGEVDQAVRCVRMALEVQARIHALAAEFERLGGAPAQVRIGIASGMVTVGAFGAAHRSDFTVVGAPVNRAARLEPLAPPGEVLIDDETRALAGEAFAFERLDDVALKGFARAQPVYRVMCEGQGAGEDGRAPAVPGG